MTGHVVALCGGVGGAKLAHGLSLALPPDELSVIVNTGDDFQHRCRLRAADEARALP
jgi:LPPG:FO 2-phospho-L-lactate transferase